MNFTRLLRKKYRGMRKYSLNMNSKMISKPVIPPSNKAITRGYTLLAGNAIKNDMASIVSILVSKGVTFVFLFIYKI